MTPTVFALALAVIFLAAVLRAFTGFGFALAAVPLLGFLVEPRVAVSAAILLQFAAGLLDFPQARKACHRPSLVPLSLGAVLAIPFGMAALAAIGASEARIAIALTTLAALAMVVLARRAERPAPGPVFGAACGAVAGFFNGLAAMPGPPAVLYYLMMPAGPAAMRASLQVFFLLNASIGLVSAVWFGLVTREVLVLAGAGLGALWLGGRVGTPLFHRAGDRWYRTAAVACLAAVALAALVGAARDLAL